MKTRTIIIKERNTYHRYTSEKKNRVILRIEKEENIRAKWREKVGNNVLGVTINENTKNK